MHGTGQMTMSMRELTQFERNRYFFGKMLDEFHFRLETDYHNGKRWLINRAVLGYGVVCGLDVIPGDEAHSIRITPGFAVDKWGREIIVPETTHEIRIPQDVIARAREGHERNQTDSYGQRQEGSYEEYERKVCVQVMICYHECETDPSPVLSGDCHSTEACVPGTIREGYRVTFTHRCEHPDNDQCQISHIASEGRIDYEALVKWVTRDRDCLSVPKEPCIRLAHVHLTEGGHECDPDRINIAVRPIVYANDLLFDILLGWQTPAHGRREK
jgi:hypothetical protein